MAVGLRGVVKTLLLNAFGEIAEEQGLHVGAASRRRPQAAGGAAPPDPVRPRSRWQGVAGGETRAWGTALLLLPGARRVVDLDQRGCPHGSCPFRDLSEDLTDLLVEAGRAARDRETGIVLAIDEVPYLIDGGARRADLRIHRTVQLDLPVVLVGAGLQQLPGLPVTRSPTPSDCSSSRRSARWIERGTGRAQASRRGAARALRRRGP
jgi:hypothetical protein